MAALAALLLQLALGQPDVIDHPAVRSFSRELLVRARAERYAEQGAFVARASDGTLYFIVWPAGAERDVLRWRGRIPRETIAILHTHPPGAPEASKIDERAARGARVPIYVITNAGIVRTTGEGSVMVVSGSWSTP